MEALAGVMFVAVGIAFIITILWILALIDILKSEFKDPNNKLVWIIVMIFLGPLGMIIYAAVGERQKARYVNKQKQEWIDSIRSRSDKDKEDFSFR